MIHQVELKENEFQLIQIISKIRTKKFLAEKQVQLYLVKQNLFHNIKNQMILIKLGVTVIKKKRKS